MPFLEISGIAYTWRYWRNKGIGHNLLTVVLYGAVAYFCLFVVPQVMESPIWAGIRISFPELFWGLLAGAALGIGWSIVYTAIILRKPKTK